MKRLLIVAIVVLSAACGGGTSPTEPSSRIPSVAGSYSGTASFAFPELQQMFTCPATTVVTQSGSSVNLAPIILNGQCSGVSIPVGQVTIDNTGAIQSDTGRGSYTEPSCGVYDYTGSGGFFGREFRLSMNGTSRTCYNFNFTAVLNKT
jgi:hypothetical protein